MWGLGGVGKIRKVCGVEGKIRCKVCVCESLCIYRVSVSEGVSVHGAISMYVCISVCIRRAIIIPQSYKC